MLINKDPTRLSDSELREMLEAIYDLLNAALKETVFPPTFRAEQDAISEDDEPRYNTSLIFNFASKETQRDLLKHKEELASFADQAKHKRGFDPAFERLADGIYRKILKLTQKLEPEGHENDPVAQLQRMAYDPMGRRLT